MAGLFKDIASQGNITTVLLVLCSLVHPPFRHCDTPTCTVQHFNPLNQKCLHFVTIWPKSGETVQPPPNCSATPLKCGSKCLVFHSDPWVCTWEIFCYSLLRLGPTGQCRTWHTDGINKNGTMPPTWVSWACSLTRPNPWYCEAHPTELYLSMVQWCSVGCASPYPWLG